MIVYKSIDQYDSNTGKKIGSQRVYDYRICDFTGKKIEHGNPESYNINFQSNDPCFGDGEGERWLYDYENNLNSANVDFYELFGTNDYMFQVDKDDMYTEVFQEMVELALKEMTEGIFSLSHLLRWSRGRMLEKVIKSGEYTIQDFIDEID